jgi:hypothetical protein
MHCNHCMQKIVAADNSFIKVCYPKTKNLKLEFRVNSADIKMSFVYDQEHPDKNKILFYDQDASNRVPKYALNPSENTLLYWDGEIRELQLFDKQIAFFLMYQFSDGDSPKPEIAIIFTDGKKFEAIMPEYEKKIDYDKTIKEIMLKYFVGSQENGDIEKITKIIKHTAEEGLSLRYTR